MHHKRHKPRRQSHVKSGRFLGNAASRRSIRDVVAKLPDDTPRHRENPWATTNCVFDGVECRDRECEPFPWWLPAERIALQR